MSRKQIKLNDKYDLSETRVYMSGTHAVIRLALMQHERDRQSGLNTAGYISGYRGSPIGTLDLHLSRIGDILKTRNINFTPGLNEDLAVTALWGAQQAELRGEGLFDGVFGLWYGKGPGVDRSGDAFRHANHAGTSKYGGVLALMGDDHTCESSTSAHQSEFAFVDAMIPVLNPAGVQEILDYGLYGWALSRFAGAWVGLKCVKDNIEQTASVDARLDRVKIQIPDDFDMPEGGLNIRLGDTPLAKEARLHDYKRYAILAFTRANRLDRLIYRGGPAPKIGIVTCGKSYLDVLEALDILGIDEVRAADIGLRLYKVALTWPLEPEGINEFAKGLDEIIVVEEKRSLIETQIREQLYGQSHSPQILGKRDADDNVLFPAKGALDPVMIARALAKRIQAYGQHTFLSANVQDLEEAVGQVRNAESSVARIPYFCSGCPHNSSTIVPEGSRAYAGIGCHYMVQWMDRSTEGFTQMGGEGANWIGEAPFSKRDHVFQNLGDGTYMHSGSLAIRAAIVAGTNITFKLLYNDAVAMTGGQPIDGGVSVIQMANQIAAEGVERIAIISDEPEKYSLAGGLPSGTSIDHRDDIQHVQNNLKSVPGVSVLIYDQTCAAEKRRRRKRGLYPDPPKRVFINERVCEGCGDCGVQSNCVSIVPVETEFGRKRAIDQSSCNKDFSCLKGFCPSFVTVHGGEINKISAADHAIERRDFQLPAIPDPELPDLKSGSYSIVVTGIGGTGIVTVGQIIGMAAHIENKGVGVIDMSGLAQKGGPVAVHVRVARSPEEINAIRASLAGADCIVGGDLVVTASTQILSTVRKGRTAIIANSHETMTADFTKNPDLQLPAEDMHLSLQSRAGSDRTHFIDAQDYALRLFQDSILSNMFLLGHASQLGYLPVKPQAIIEAIGLNGVAVEKNTEAFNWGRFAAFDLETFKKNVPPKTQIASAPPISSSFEDRVALRVDELTKFQDAAYARRFADAVEKMSKLEEQVMPGQNKLREAVLTSYHKLLAYKDEYEVARLYTDGTFRKQLRQQFGGNYKIKFHLAPPILAQKDPNTGLPRKRAFGGWVLHLLKLLAAFKSLRGTRLDPFGYSSERQTERQLIAEFEQHLQVIGNCLGSSNYDIAVELAERPQSIRGYGHVKEAAVGQYRARSGILLETLRTGEKQQAIAAE